MISPEEADPYACYICRIDVASHILACNHLVCSTCVAMYKVKEIICTDIKCLCNKSIEFSKMQERKLQDRMLHCDACDTLVLTVCDTCQKPYCNICFETKHYYHEDHKLIQHGPTICNDHNLPKVYYCKDCNYPAWFCLMCKERHKHKKLSTKKETFFYTSEYVNAGLISSNGFQEVIDKRKNADVKLHMQDYKRCTTLIRDAQSVIQKKDATPNEMVDMQEKLARELKLEHKWSKPFLLRDTVLPKYFPAYKQASPIHQDISEQYVEPKTTRCYLFGKDWITNDNNDTFKEVYEGTDLVHVKKVVIGKDCSLILNENGLVYVIGKNDVGQLGITQTAAHELTLLKYKNRQLKAKDIATSPIGHTLIVHESGKLLVCGNNRNGQLAFNQKTVPQILSLCLNQEGYVPEKIERVFANGYEYADATYGFSMALTENGDLYGWGSNHNKSLGIQDGTNKENYYPKKIISMITDVALGSDYALLLSKLLMHADKLENGSHLYGTGQNTLGFPMGSKFTSGANAPQPLKTFKSCKNIYAGINCAVVYAKTENDNYSYWIIQRTINSFGFEWNKISALQGIEVVDLSIGDSQILVRAKNKSSITPFLLSWGKCEYGSLGFGASVQERKEPRIVTCMRGRNVLKICAGSNSSMIVCE